MPIHVSLPHIEDCQKRIRAYISGVCLIDTTQAKLVWLHQRFPVYAFTREDIPSWYIRIVSENENQIVFEVYLGSEDREKHPRIVFHLTGPLIGLGLIEFDDMDAWFEEEEQIYFHAKDRYKRIDILPSSRHVRIEVNGVEIANTHSPFLMFETFQPMRIYIPKTHCRMDLLHSSELKSGCPYKGLSNHYNVVLSTGETFENVAWTYPHTTLECALVKGLVAVYDEKVDVWLDGEKRERPSEASDVTKHAPEQVHAHQVTEGRWSPLQLRYINVRQE